MIPNGANRMRQATVTMQASVTDTAIAALRSQFI
jgi:hypothetical protein